MKSLLEVQGVYINMFSINTIEKQINKLKDKTEYLIIINTQGSDGYYYYKNTNELNEALKNITNMVNSFFDNIYNLSTDGEFDFQY